ncbi:MAG: hypothetical protein ACRDUY_16455 [Nitriliruptorales bacterium]
MVGLFALVTVIPFGALGLISVAIAVIAIRRGRGWPEALGLLAGVGALALIAGVNNVGPPPACSEADMATTSSCRGVPPTPFIVVGAGLVVASVGAYLVARRGMP